MYARLLQDYDVPIDAPTVTTIADYRNGRRLQKRDSSSKRLLKKRPGGRQSLKKGAARRLPQGGAATNYYVIKAGDKAVSS